MGCPYSHNDRTAAVLRSGAADDDGPYRPMAAATCATDAPTTDVVDFGCYGRVVAEAAVGPPAFSAEQRRLIRETWAKLSPQSTAVGKQVALSSPFCDSNAAGNSCVGGPKRTTYFSSQPKQ